MTGRGRENLLATPAFYGPDRKGTATVVGLAAFSHRIQGADRQRGHGGPRHGGAHRDARDQAPHGLGARADPGSDRRRPLELTGQPAASCTSRLVHHFKLPSPESPEVRGRGLALYRLELDAGHASQIDLDRP